MPPDGWQDLVEEAWDSLSRVSGYEIVHRSPGEQVALLVESLAEALFEHLDLEEREILLLVARHVMTVGSRPWTRSATERP